MSKALRRILTDMRRENKRRKIEQQYEEKERLIPYPIYHEFKAKRKCQECKNKFTHPLRIHHKIPVSQGGTNTRENLMAVCNECHNELDKEALK